MSTNTLTERYVHEVVRRIPADQRDDVAEELRTTIADTMDAHGSDDPTVAEREVLTEMGDPIQLAARYADRPLALIGPKLYPSYIRLLKILLSAVLPVVVVAIVALDVLDNNDVGSAFGAGIGAVLTVGGQMIAWLTGVFALVERFGNQDLAAENVKAWTPDDLPEERRPRDGGLDCIASVVWNALLIALIVWQHAAQPWSVAGGERMEVLDPALWSGWIWPILAGLAGIVVIDLIRFATRNWTLPLLAGYTIAEAVFALPLAWILYQHITFNPEFLATFNDDWTIANEFYTAAALGVLAVSAMDVVKRFRLLRR
jgi:hypothetical protein